MEHLSLIHPLGRKNAWKWLHEYVPFWGMRWFDDISERLSSLAILHIHRDREIGVDTVITKFISIKNRSMKLVLLTWT